MAVLNQKEIFEAIREWCDKRSIPVPGDDDIEILARFVSQQPPGSDVCNPYYVFRVKIKDITMPVKEGPYR